MVSGPVHAKVLGHLVYGLTIPPEYRLRKCLSLFIAHVVQTKSCLGILCDEIDKAGIVMQPL